MLLILFSQVITQLRDLTVSGVRPSISPTRLGAVGVSFARTERSMLLTAPASKGKKHLVVELIAHPEASSMVY